MSRRGAPSTLLVLLTVASGCARGPETSYGSSRGASLNGTGAFASLVESRGHEVRTARRLTDELAGWASVIVRFATAPGPPDRDEARWYETWLDDQPGRALIYVVRDYDSRADYWRGALDQLGGPADEALRAEAESKLDEARRWVDDLPSKSKEPAPASSWFAVDRAILPPPVCTRLEGPWARDVNAGAVAIPVHEPLEAHPDRDLVLLSGDGKVLAMEWQTDNTSRVLAVASGAFLLNLPVAIPARRPLAARVADWIGDGPQRAAFVDGPAVLGGPRPPPNLLDLLGRISSFRWAAIHLGLFGLIAALARAPRLGRPRPDPRPDTDRPAAHAEALGSLLERARGREAASAILESYRRWRSPRVPGGRSANPRGPGAERRPPVRVTPE
jgi:hypothetical protein